MFDKVAVELGKNIIKIVRGKCNKKIFLSDYFEIDINDCSDWADERYNDTLLANLLAEAFNTHKLDKRNVRIVLSCLPNLLIREMVVPYTNERETYNMIKFEAKDYFPIDLDNFVIDYKLVEIIKEGRAKKQRILVIVVPKNLVQKIQSVSKQAGLNIKSIDIEANVLSCVLKSYRAFSQNTEAGTEMVLNLEKGYVTAAIIRNGTLSMAKTFLEDLYKLSDTGDKGDDFSNQLMINDIVDNIMKVMNFYVNRENSEINKIYVTGKMAYCQSITKLLNDRGGIEIEIMGGTDFIDGKNKLSGTDVCSYAVAAGGIL